MDICCIQPKRYIMSYNIITSLFMLSLLALLIYMGGIYLIGKYEMYVVPLVLVLFELVKYYISYCYFTEVKMTKTRRLIKKIRFTELATSLGIILFMVVLFYAIAILFGAQLLSNQEETLMFSVLLTTLTVVPSCLHLGPANTIEVLSTLTECKGYNFSIVILRNIQMTLAGAWLGAIVIPLDWDRPWQVWPIPCSTGALVGYTVGNIVNSIILIK